MSDYKHGNYIYEAPTSIVPPVTVTSAMPVAFVTAPLHLTADPYNKTNKPTLCYTYAEAVEAFGFSLRPEIWNNYTAPQVIYSQFALYAVAPIVIVNVLDPKVHRDTVTDDALTLEGYESVLEVDGVLIDTVVIKSKPIDEGESTTYEAGSHYTLAFNTDGHVVINAKRNATGGMSANKKLLVTYTMLKPELVDIYDIIGGYDAHTGKLTGLEIMNEIYPRFRLVPGQLLVPGFSEDPSVAAIMETKSGNINGHFRCIALNDLPTMVEDSGSQDKKSQHRYTDVPAWKNQNNYVSTRQVNGYPRVRLGEQVFHYSTQLAGLVARTDAENSGIPYNSPSNKGMEINGLCYADGEEMVLNVEQANYLNGNGIITANNFTNGWVAWGNRTGCYPGNTDPKDAFIPIRRMFDWIGNTIVLTYWSKIDFPLTRRTIATIVDSINIWLNGLAAREFILGGRIEFLDADNPATDLIDGIVKFRVKIAPPPPMRETQFILEYDPAYLQTLFATT